MCGRYSLATDLNEFLQQLGLTAPEELLHPRRYNIAPSQPVLGLVADPMPRLEVMEWGFVPSWAKPETNPKPVINARVESLHENKPYFRGAFKSSRCAILADGFYEWQKVGKEKHPFRISLREGGVFAMAGLWSWHQGTGGDDHATCAIVTVEPNELMEDIHNRMPAILRPEDLNVWLDPKARQQDLFSSLEPYPADEMKAYEISTRINSPANDSPDCIKSISDDE